MSLEELAGKAKELFGRVTGDKKTEVEGKVEATGANLKNKVHDAMDKAEAKKKTLKLKRRLLLLT
ncbi:CsbD family protein [Globicatella sp. PHS-GS-PNBC-21-1553]|uniref:CsbD family protein n=1 Tax=Globicatella sp. PHS-GS-PNBC-21-1553 TaxID=2885764 RepID=UPI00298EE11F|nr:CsbD family protein [Globicatella sp. PHS-GS-PNBC-21-1553]WPC07887.1 CsbD family protein [Globicatella sp. PHS-GS-PNBC-21-1553]